MRVRVAVVAALVLEVGCGWDSSKELQSRSTSALSLDSGTSPKHGGKGDENNHDNDFYTKACQSHRPPSERFDDEHACRLIGLSPDPANAVLSQATATRPGDSRVLMIPFETYAQYKNTITAVKAPPSGHALSGLNTGANDLIAAGIRTASVGNDSWTWAAYGPLSASTRFSGNIFIVTRDAKLNPSSQVVTQDYFVVVGQMSGNTPWSVDTGVAFGLKVNPTVGDSRCCGPSLSCQQTSPMQPGGAGCGGPPALCGGGSPIAQVYEGGNSQGTVRAAEGLPPIDAVVYGSNNATPLGLDCLAPVGQDCTISLPTCDFGGPDGLGNGDTPTLPSGHTCTGQDLEHPAQGATVDKRCIYADEADVSMFGPGGPPPEPACQGMCPDCATPFSGVDSSGQPKQCEYSDPVPGSDLCASKTPAQLAVEQAALAADVANSSCSATTGGPQCCGANCACFSAHYPPDPTLGGNQACVQCNANGCSTFLRVNPNDPHAEDKNSSQSQPQGCSGREDCWDRGNKTSPPPDQQKKSDKKPAEAKPTTSQSPPNPSSNGQSAPMPPPARPTTPADDSDKPDKPTEATAKNGGTGGDPVRLLFGSVKS